MEKSVKMIAAASAALYYKRSNPAAGNDALLKYIFGSTRSERDPEAKIGMIAAASKASEILEKFPNLKDKEILKIVISEMPEMINSITSSDNHPLGKR
jgi:hypothetical protein